MKVEEAVPASPFLTVLTVSAYAKQHGTERIARGANQSSKDDTHGHRQLQRPESPTVTLTSQARKHSWGTQAPPKAEPLWFINFWESFSPETHYTV